VLRKVGTGSFVIGELFCSPIEKRYICTMKGKVKKTTKKDKSLREQILQSMLASFKIEGINIPQDAAVVALKKVEFSLGK
jgi:hypothetical protein